MEVARQSSTLKHKNLRLNVLEWSLDGFFGLEARVAAIGKCVSG